MTIEYPKTLYVAQVYDVITEQFQFVATTDLEEIAQNDDAPVKIARYVLAGTGSLHLSAPRYLEDAGS